MDGHALRTAFVSWLGQAGVNLRIAQRLARHKPLDSTTGPYQDPYLLDAQGAVNKLPDIFGEPTEQRALATGTDDRSVSDTARPVVVPVVVTSDFSRPHVSSSVTTEGISTDSRHVEKPPKTLVKVDVCRDVSSSDALGDTGLEPVTSCVSSRRSSHLS